MKQLEGKDTDNMEDVELQPVELSLAVLKEVGAKWLVGMADYISSNPQIVVNGFMHAGITRALDGLEDESSDSTQPREFDSDSDSDCDVFELDEDA